MLKLIFLTITQSILMCSAQSLFKVAAEKMGDFAWTWAFFKGALSTWQLYVAGITAIAGVIEWMYVLKRYDLSLAYPLTAISFILSLIAGAAIFHEVVPPTRWIGVVLIMAGAFLVSR